MKKPPLFLLLLAICAAFAMPVWAEKADRDKTMILDADTMRIDDVKQLIVADGNVVMTKGTIVVRAAHIDAREDSEGYQLARITGAPDKPAFFKQKRDSLDEFIEVQSERIDYDGRADTVTFTGKALMRRLRGAVLADEITGAVIVYENLTDKFSVDGSSSKVGSVAAPGSGRVRAMLTPKTESTEALAPQPSSKAQVQPILRPTATLGSPPQ